MKIFHKSYIKLCLHHKKKLTLSHTKKHLRKNSFPTQTIGR